MKKESLSKTGFRYLALLIWLSVVGVSLLVQPLYAQAGDQPRTAPLATAAAASDSDPITTTLTSTLQVVDTPGLQVELPGLTSEQSSQATATAGTVLFFPLINR